MRVSRSSRRGTMAPEPRRALVVDDEAGARLDLIGLLARDPAVDVVAQAGDLESAVEAVRRLRPDLVFLDIRLGRRSGFELLDLVDEVFDVVFVTAHDEHAVLAFEVDAIDYLLKPVEPERLRATLERLDAPSDAPVRALEMDDWLFLPLEGGRGFLQVSDIAHVTADGDYTIVHTVAGERHRVPRALKKWEARLPASGFLRIHRGTIVNLGRVRRVEPWSNYTYRVYMEGVRRPLTMSRHYARRAQRLLG